MCAHTCDEYSKPSSDPSGDYVTACEGKNLILLPKEAASEPVIL